MIQAPSLPRSRLVVAWRRVRRAARWWMGVGVVCACAVSQAQDVPETGVGGEVRAPFSEGDPAAAVVQMRDDAWLLELGDSAQRGGFHALAERYYVQVMERPGRTPEIQRRATLGRVDALIGQGRGTPAATALDEMAGGRDDAWRLRRGIAHFLVATTTAVRDEAARAEWQAMLDQIRDLRPEVLGRDVAWWFFLRAMAASRAGEVAQADSWLERATQAAVSEAERSILRLARFQAGLSVAEVSEASAATLLANAERQQGRPLGLQFTLQYAVVLDRLGDKNRAVAVLKRQRETMPATEVELRDQTLLLLGLIAGAATDDGRSALRELLERGRDVDFQRIALMRLAAAGRAESPTAAADLRRIITALLERTEPHPLTEDLLFFRAELLLRARAFEEAEADARALLSRFPGSTRLQREALAILASSAWQRPPRFRTAADYIAQIRALPTVPPEDQGRLAFLQGECHFRAGRADNTVEDFRNAAEAYAAVAAGGTLPDGVSAGVVFFQRVLSLINARAIDAAIRLLDDPVAREGVDPESWWQAEWNLARELQLAGRGDEALRRADALGPVGEIPPALRLRFLWLAAQVSLAAGLPEETDARVGEVRRFLAGSESAGIDDDRRADVLSNAALVAAESRLRAGDRDGGRRALDALRTEFPASPAADYSYIVEAGVLAAENRLVPAMDLLLQLADTRSESRYAPEALYQAALLSIQRGQREHLEYANLLLDRLAGRYPAENHVFQARVKQADVLRSLGRFSDAEAVYRDLEAKYPNHGDRAIVQISLAAALMAQASVEPGKFDGAASRLERILANETLPVDLRAEAGTRLAEGWQAQGNSARAAEIFWEVNRRFAEDPRAAAALGATGPSWVSRALFLLGEIEERENRFDNARRLYQSILDHGLPGDRLARARIQRLQAPAGGG